jgi:adenylate kinase
MICQCKNDRAAWLVGATAICSTEPNAPPRPWRLVLIGAPGVGKGTQAQLLSQRLRSCHLSTGDVFRAAKSIDEIDRTPAMSDALEYMVKGELVPDEIVLNVLRERKDCLMCCGGFLLDGFPRTVAQAQALDDLLQSQQTKLDAVIDYRLPRKQIIQRLTGRRTCTKCKAVFHVTNLPPRKEGICDGCGGELIQREDDRPASVRVRLEACETQTAPLTEYYRRKGLLIAVDASGSAEDVCSRTVAPFGVGLERARG